MSAVFGHHGANGLAAYAWGSLPAEILDRSERYVIAATEFRLSLEEIREDLLRMWQGQVTSVGIWQSGNEIHLTMG